jgi:hypothetical protein
MAKTRGPSRPMFVGEETLEVEEARGDDEGRTGLIRSKQFLISES